MTKRKGHPPVQVLQLSCMNLVQYPCLRHLLFLTSPFQFSDIIDFPTVFRNIDFLDSPMSSGLTALSNLTLIKG